MKFITKTITKFDEGKTFKTPKSNFNIPVKTIKFKGITMKSGKSLTPRKIPTAACIRAEIRVGPAIVSDNHS